MKSTQAAAEKVFFPNLDALRFFAFLVVFVSHCFIFMGYHNDSKIYTACCHFFEQGDMGVSFFFVLSGFLITYLLFRERELRPVRLGAFYFRRVLRIWPVYFLVIFIGFFILPHIHFISDKKQLFGFPIHADRSRLYWYVLFVSNFDLILNSAISVVVVSLWSVSVEEQFYLFWPLFIKYIRPKRLVYLFYGILIAAFAYRCYYAKDIVQISFATPSVVYYLAIGALAAYYSLYSEKFMRTFVSLKRWKIVLIYSVGLCMFPMRGFSHIFGESIHQFYIPFEAPLFSLFFAFVILEQNFSEHSFFKAGRSRIVNYLGRISYGLYCYHFLAIVLVLSLFLQAGLDRNALSTFLLIIIVSLVLTVLISIASYVAVEKRLIKFKAKYALVKKQEG